MRKFLLLCLLFVGFCFSTPTFSLTDKQLQSAMIYGFLRYIEWPQNYTIDTYRIAVLGGDTALRDELNRAAKEVRIHGKKVLASDVDWKRLNGQNFEVVFVSDSLNSRVASIANSLRRTNTLLITRSSDAKRDIMINLYKQNDGTTKFDVNRTNIVFERLKVDKEILLLGGTELDVAELFRESEYSLQKIKEELLGKERNLSRATGELAGIKSQLKQDKQLIDQQKRQLAEQTSALDHQQEQIQSQQAAIDEHKTEIEQQAREVLRQQRELEAQRLKMAQQKEGITENEGRYQSLLAEVTQITSALSDKQAALSASESALDKKQRVLKSREQKVSSLTGLIEKNNSILEEQEQNLLRQRQVLSVQSDTIMRQRSLLVASVLVLLVFLGLIVTILTINRARKRTIEELHDTHLALQRASQAKSEFLAKMSHEIRTPMTGVLGMSELLAEMGLSRDQKKCNDVIHASGTALLTIINDILDYSKIEAGKMRIESISFDLERLVTEVTRMFRLRAEEKRLVAIADIDPQLPRFVIGDPTRLRQILINLFGNAFKFTNEGQILLTVTAVADQPGKIVFSVADSGIGISAEQQHKLFSAFSQADETTARKYGGTGLGLAICKQLVELMNGDISVQSQLGEGSCFSVTLTLPEDQQHSVEAEPSGLSEPSCWTDKRLLIVDDNRVFCDIFCRQARNWGLHVEQATGATEAFDKLQTAQREGHAFDVMLSDINMPSQDGIALSQRIAADKSLVDLKVILATASRSVPKNIELHHAQVHLATEKPILAQELKEMLWQVFSPTSASGSEGGDHESELATPPLASPQPSLLRLLVAEDNPVVRQVMVGMLKKCGLQAQYAENGQQALDKVQAASEPFDLVFMDCEMPEMNGFDATRMIRAWEQEQQLAPTPIYALSAHVLPEYVEEGKQCGMNDFIMKPVSLETLREKLQPLLAQAKLATMMES